jgi:uncharacterized lipoprotein YddW (UPF0748 family)
LWVVIPFLLPGLAMAQATGTPAMPAVPATPREFRGIWIASHVNIDWPSRAGLPSSQQQAELVAILDRAVSMNANAVILQVRPTGETLYASDIEPWAAVLSGSQGTPPNPPYDPLAFAIREAHARGLQLHAWLNPFRVGTASGRNSSPRHVSQTRPALVRRYGAQQWMDPGEAETQEYVLRIVRELIGKYEIDALHFDDYFYPYKEKDKNGRLMEFPDEASFRKYQAGGGKLARADWRRDNVNRFIRRVHEEVRRSPRPLLFGISPFGIWRPGHPEGVRGLDAYNELYADARLWMREGWADYFSPQLYWRIDAPGQKYVDLLGWWEGQNTRGRHLWPGLASWRAAEAKDGWSVGELTRQIQITQRRPRTTGTILYNTSSIMKGSGAIPNALSRGSGPWSQPALVPASPWIRAQTPATPRITGERGGADGAQFRLRWEATGGTPLNWVLKVRRGTNWTTSILPPTKRDGIVQMNTTPRPDFVAVHAVDRLGNESEPALWRLP